MPIHTRPYGSLALAAAAFAALGACSRGAPTPNSSDSAAGTVATDPPARVARLSAVDGDVALQTADTSNWVQATPNYTVTTGDRVATGKAGRAELDLGSAAMRFNDDADVMVTNLTDHFTQLGVDQGALDASLYQYDPADSVEIDTPNGALVPTSAGTYYVSIDPNDDATLVNVVSGALSLTGPGISQVLNGGQLVRLVGTNPIQVVSVTEPVTAFTPLDRWRAERDVRWQPGSSTVRYVNTSTPGWEDLDDNGNWVADQSSTEVWCPTRTTKAFVPYRAGHWSWVEPWGWTWVDDAPWGYTTSHYGRWERVTTSSCQNSNNWAWVPGPTNVAPVYAPALVAFVDGATLSLATSTAAPAAEAWFPLGPSEPFYPTYRYSNDYLHAINAANLRQVRDVNALLRERQANRDQWAYRTVALTAVPATIFVTGQPVLRHELRLRPQQIASARIAPRPALLPGHDLLIGGRPAPRPPVAARPQYVVTRGAPGKFEHGPVAAPGQVKRATGPVASRHGGVAPAPMARSAPGEVGRPLVGAPPAAGHARGAPTPYVEHGPPASRVSRAPSGPRPIITRNAPPARRAPQGAPHHIEAPHAAAPHAPAPSRGGPPPGHPGGKPGTGGGRGRGPGGA
jgi:uncharacterized protein DUF6600